MAAEQEEGSGGKKASAALQQAGQFGKDHWKAIGVIIAAITLVFVYLQWRNSQAAAAATGMTGADPNAVIDTSLGGNPTTSTTGSGSGTGGTSGSGGGNGSGSGSGNTAQNFLNSTGGSLIPKLTLPQTTVRYSTNADASYVNNSGNNLPTAPSRTLR